MGAGAGADRGPATGDRAVRRLVCVSVNPAIDKIAAVPRLVPGEIHRPEMLSVVAGGKALNVARAARTCGLDVAVVAVLGGHAGDWMEEQLSARGIRTRAVRVPGETRTCLSVLDRESGGLTEFYEDAPALPSEAWPALELSLRAELTEGAGPALVAASGSLPQGAPPDGYGRLAAIATEMGARAIVDTGGLTLAAALPHGPWLVKVNLREAAEACGLTLSGTDGALAAAHELRDRGARAALVTLGPVGAVLEDADGADWLIGPPPELGRFSVGSGDALLAGLAAGLAHGLSLPEAARSGAAAACASALRPGQGELDPSDMERVLAAISLTRR